MTVPLRIQRIRRKRDMIDAAAVSLFGMMFFLTCCCVGVGVTAGLHFFRG